MRIRNDGGGERRTARVIYSTTLSTPEESERKWDMPCAMLEVSVVVVLLGTSTISNTNSMQEKGQLSGLAYSFANSPFMAANVPLAIASMSHFDCAMSF
jgi:hypothetical protein